MKIRVVAIVVFLLVVGGGLAVRFRQKAVESVHENANAGHAHSSAGEPDVPVPPKTGPFAKFVVEGEPIHTFGVMEHGQDGEHEFKIRNDGQSPLKMVALAKDHTCQCTLGSLGKDGLQPGESTTVKMTWKIKNPATLFEHSAKIRTNDPKTPVTTFIVRGLVGKRISVHPGLEVVVGLLSEKEPTERMLTLHSEVLDAFQINKIETSHPLITVETLPLDAEQLTGLTNNPKEEEASRAMKERMSEELSKSSPDSKAKVPTAAMMAAENPLIGKKPPAKCGYAMTLRFQPGFAIGKFRETVSIHTDIRNNATKDSLPYPPLVISVQGSRSGPVEMLALGTGLLWSPEESVLRLGRFPAKEGKIAKLLVFIAKSDDELKIVEAKLEPPTLKFDLKKDEKFQQPRRDKYTLTVEVPAGGAPLSLGGGARQGKITLQTNHPDAKTITMDLEFTSF